MFAIQYAEATIEHFKAIEKKHHALIINAVREQLSDEPLAVTRNRKPLKPGSVFSRAWELRCGPRNRFRIFYDTDTNKRVVTVLAIGEKAGSILRISGEVFNL